YSFVFRNTEGQSASGEGTFTCVTGRRPSPGFLRLHPANSFRFVFDDGSPYFPIGLQDCWGDNSASGSVLGQCSMEGPFRTDRKDSPALPDGPMFVRGPSCNPQNADVYFRYFSKCGFNLYRFSQQNCSYPLNNDLDKYLVQEGMMTDELLQRARAYGFGVFYGIFGFQKAFNDEADDQAKMAKVKRFVKYSVDRWGAYVDFWEFLNEQKAGDRWYEIMIPYIKSLDPYRHPVTTSWERPELAGIEINAPHWYQNENELESDKVTVSRAKNWKKHNMPVVVGEQGNYIDRKKPVPGVGGVWDERSALRMRIRNWTAMFNEIAFVFWNTSYARDGHFMNIWLGPKEREYVRAMQDFAYRLDKDVHIAPVEVSQPEAVRAYGLASEKRAGVYLHHFSDHTTAVKDVTVTLGFPVAAKAYWYSPENAEILKIVDVSAGANTLEAPEFTVDLALLITPDGPPDIDRDGKPNHIDPDDDNDGVADKDDAFPLDPGEWADGDGDWIGDNLDADRDGDGIGDDDNNNGVPDFEELDLDGDGVDRAKSVPWDAFPLDPKEWKDTDGDGTGDNADLDDDNDGFSDREEKKYGTDPLDSLSFPADR
ncbi:MAG: thrombospondin type 3 repeat-containing protein, partial [Planctomycetota bacterium]